MPDLRDRFRALDQLEVPDVHERARDIGPRLTIDPGPPASRRVAAGAVALLVAAAAIAFAIGRIGGTVPDRSPAEEPSVPATPADAATPSPTLAPEPAVEVLGPVPVGPRGQTTAIAADRDAVWVSYYDDEGGHLVKLDPETLEVVLVLDDAPVPAWETGGGGLASDGSRVVALGTHDRGAVLAAYDASSGEEVARLPLGSSGGAGDVVISGLGNYALTSAPDPRDGMLLYAIDSSLGEASPPTAIPGVEGRRVVAVGGYVAVFSATRTPDHRPVLTLVDWEGGGIIEQRETDLNTYGASVIGGFTGWALDRSGRSIVELSGDDLLRTIRELRLPGRAWGLADGAGGIWAVGDGQAWRLDPGSGEVELTVELPEDAGATATATRDAVYLLNFDGGVTRIARPG